MRYISKGATISRDGKYRYRLWREWRSPSTTPKKNWYWWRDEDGEPCLDGAGVHIGEPKTVVFIMLNPSTADGEKDDATIRKCVSFAKGFGYDRMDILNLFGFRARDPKQLLALNHDDDPVGVHNQREFQRTFQDNVVGLVICAWGNHGRFLDQHQTALGWFDHPKLHALRISKDNNPGHPLYLPGNSPLLEYRP